MNERDIKLCILRLVDYMIKNNNDSNENGDLYV